MKYNLGNIFLEKSYANVVEKLVPNFFIKNQNWAYLWINSLKSLTVYFYCMPKWRSIKTKVRTQFVTDAEKLYQAFSETKSGLELVSLLHLLHDFGRKIFPTLYSVCDVINFEIKLPVWPKSQDKNLNILRTKIAFNIK